MIGTRLKHGWTLVRYLGPRWLAYRLLNSVRMKSGLIRRQIPATPWSSQLLSSFVQDPALVAAEQYADYRRSSAPKFFFESKERSQFQPIFSQWDKSDVSPLVESDQLAEGVFRFFSNEKLPVGFPPCWHTDPKSRYEFPQDRHWSQIGDFDAGDIKRVWELNRFGFVFSLVRAYWRTGDAKYPELFWKLVESWYESNPPQYGINWKCGQEISLRVMSWCFGLYGFADSISSTPERITKLAQMIAVSGRRIHAHIGYALSQNNNHGISEATGLWTIGTLFPEFRESQRWANVGRRLLERLSRELIYDDGAFSQHSMNYHRVMLHGYLWSMRLADIQGQPFSKGLRDRIARSGEFLYQMQDEHSGDVPCYGQDDGALILPLSHCGYRDFRPAVQSIIYLTSGQRRLKPGPWDEDLLWLSGTTAFTDLKHSHRFPHHAHNTDVALINTPHPRHNFEATEGGYSTLRSPQGFAAVRAARFRHRPSQADMLHVDIWWRGQNIAVDPGSFSYNAPPPWNNPFAHSAHHNTVTVDGQDQMERVSRFLWLPWINGKSLGRIVPLYGDVSCWNGEHDGYQQLSDPVTHRRGIVRLGSEHWLIVDSLCGQQPHQYRLHWLLMNAPFAIDQANNSLELQTPVGPYRIAAVADQNGGQTEVVRAAETSARGWRSRYYDSREPAISFSLEMTAPSALFATVLGPDAMAPVVQTDQIRVQGPDWQAIISLSIVEGPGHSLIKSLDVSGSLLNPFSPQTQVHRRPTQEPQSCTSY